MPWQARCLHHILNVIVHAARRQASSPNSPQPQKRRKTASSTSPPTLAQTEALTILLGHTEALSKLIAWLDAGSVDAPPVTIDESMVEIIQLSSLTAQHYPALQHLQRQGVFDQSGWQQITATRPELDHTSGLLLLNTPYYL